MIGISHFDNSANNRFNPDPTKEILWGPQNWDEMSNCFIGVIIDVQTRPGTVFSGRDRACCRAGFRVRRWLLWKPQREPNNRE